MIIAIILFITGLTGFIFGPSLLDKEYLEETNFADISRKIKRTCLFLMVTGFSVFTIPRMFFWAEPGHTYFLTYPSGSYGVVSSQGIKPAWFAKIESWPKYIDVKTTVEGQKKDPEIEGYMSPIPIRFIDQVTASVHVSARFQIPVDDQDFVNMAIKYRTRQNLVQNTLIPAIKEQAINTGYMYAAQDYISGEAQSFRQDRKSVV